MTDCLWRGTTVGQPLAAAFGRQERHLPPVGELLREAMARRFGRGEADFALPEMSAGGHGDAALSVVVHGAVEMIHRAFVLHHVALVGEHLVVWF